MITPRLLSLAPGLTFVFLSFLFLSGQLQSADREVGVLLKEPAACDGYTLFTSIVSTATYLIDLDGRIVNRWESDFKPGHSAYLRENGHLLRGASVGLANKTFRAGGAGGRIQEFSWEGELLWDYEYSTPTLLQHHDFEPLPNGNVLLIVWEAVSREEAVAAGRNPDAVSNKGLWTDRIVEVKPTGKKGGEIVWEWRIWDHLVQEYDPEMANYGVVADHPELINLNPLDWVDNLAPKERQKLEAIGYLSARTQLESRGRNPDWTHFNSVAYDAELDQILISVLGFNEVWIIDHSTTTEEAAGHKGGRSRKGGDLLYRWGNPASYHRGGAEDQKLFAQHDAQWIADGLDGAGHILVFNNGRGRIGDDYSSVDEIVPPLDENGRYTLEKKSAFGPKDPIWSYSAEPKKDLYSINFSGAQRLPNGNTLICSGRFGTLLEVTREGEVVWKYFSPLFNALERRPGQRGRPPAGNTPIRGTQNSLFKVCRYAPDYPGLAGKTLKPGPTVEESQ